MELLILVNLIVNLQLDSVLYECIVNIILKV